MIRRPPRSTLFPCPTLFRSVPLAGVARHRLRHAEDVSASGTREAVPQPHIRNQLGVVPCETADIVAPGVTRRFVRVHDVAVVPETVPVALLHFLLIKREGSIELFFHPLSGRRRPVRQTPYAERLCDMQILRRAHE